MDKAIDLENVCFRYSPKQQILSNISLSVPRGSIYVFLGPNGAGKSTTIRIVMGLLKATSGKVSVLGSNFIDNRCSILSKIGSLIDAPTFYDHLTAIDNLKIICIVRGINLNEIKPTLELVGLSASSRLKVCEFSLGMKQRLALAMALISRPELLILDEPSNGLDPNGIIEIRELLIKINKTTGTTIFVSSHILAEVEKLCSHICVINNGYSVFEGNLTELQQQFGAENKAWFKLNTTSSISQLNCNSIIEVDHSLSRVAIPYNSDKDISSFTRLLLDNKLEVYEVTKELKSLEDLYMKLVKQ